MYKGLLIISCLTLTLGLVVLSGCEGEKGPIGPKGDRGRGGEPGIDPELLKPDDRYFGVGVLNAHESAVNGDMRVYMSFDSTVRASRDTVVAARLTTPPLIDGIDGEEVEWGPQKSRIRAVFLNPLPGLTDPEIDEIVCRAAWDDYYIYTFFQWKEEKVSVNVGGRDSSIYETNSSDQPKEMFFNARQEIITDIDSITDPEHPDTTFFEWIRVPILNVDTLFCITDPITGDTVFCDIRTTYGDTALVWLAPHNSDDKLAVFWGDAAVDNWSELAFREFFGMAGAGGALPAELFVDAWVWGSATSNPVTAADDWFLTSSGRAPDHGGAPYLDNYVLPDSIPRYQSFRDPNVKTQANLQVETYPLWYFNAVGYSVKGWDKIRQVYLPGIVTMIPTGSRSDIYARATIDELGTWTLEMRRARRTSNGDDVAF